MVSFCDLGTTDNNTFYSPIVKVKVYIIRDNFLYGFCLLQWQNINIYGTARKRYNKNIVDRKSTQQFKILTMAK